MLRKLYSCLIFLFVAQAEIVLRHVVKRGADPSSDEKMVDSIKKVETPLEKFHIIIENTLPQYQHYYRRNEKESVILKNIIDDLLKNKMIRNSKSPWGAPCFVVKKPNDQHRMVVDYRKLNKVTKAHQD